MAARLLPVATAMMVSIAVLSASQLPGTQTFDGVAVGAMPSGFTTDAIRQDHPGTWGVARIGTNAALRHGAVTGATGWSLALTPTSTTRGFRLSGRVRLTSGSRAGGLVWHFKDARNFMAVILDLVDGDIELFRVADGNRIRLDDRDGLDLDPQAWHTLRVTSDNGKTTVAIGGIRVLDRNERRASTTGGRVGIVAHGAADAAFDDIRVDTATGRQER